MKAFRMVGWKQPFEFQDVPQPDPRPGQVLIKVAAAGLCHSDLTVQGMDPGVMNAEIPFTLGHETTGGVEALDLREVIALAGTGVLQPKLTTFAFDQAPAAYQALHDGTLEGRAVVLPDG